MLLNNDTIFTKNLINKILDFMDNNPGIGVSTPCIYSAISNRIWNCGGILTFFGSNIYYNSDKLINKKEGYLKISFITCCATIFRKKILTKYGLLTEDYFFGEEDYEYSIRVRKNKVKMAGILGTRLYHIEGVSSRKLKGKELKFAFIHHLNRLVHMKSYYPKPIWEIWRFFIFIYLLLLLILTHQIDLKTKIAYINKQFQYSNKLMKVDKEPFMRIMNEKFE